MEAPVIEQILSPRLKLPPRHTGFVGGARPYQFPEWARGWN